MQTLLLSRCNLTSSTSFAYCKGGLSFLHSYIKYFTIMIGAIAVCLALLARVDAQYFPPVPENVTKVNSKLQEGVYVSFKEVCQSLASGMKH